MEIGCPVCQEKLAVGEERKAVVVICNPKGFPDGKARSVATDRKLWGDAATRVEWSPDANPDNVTHVLQLKPPVQTTGQRLMELVQSGDEPGSEPLDPMSFEHHRFHGEGGPEPVGPESFGGSDFGGIGDGCTADRLIE